MTLRTSKAPAACFLPGVPADRLLASCCAHRTSLLTQRKMTFRMMTMTSEMPASFVGDRYQGSRCASGSVRCSFGVSE